MPEGWSEEDIAGFADNLQRFDTSIERLHGKAWPRPEPGAGAG
ncbi:hypothetical protein [Streptomyces sp. 1222.2]|nr:hypothetical protein [Streptomyces sp. 1222.2]